MASMLVASMPRFAKSSAAAASTFWWARSLRPRATGLHLYLGEAPGAETDEHESEREQHGCVHCGAKVRLLYERRPQAIHPIRQRIQPRQRGQEAGQVVQRIQRTGKEE